MLKDILVHLNGSADDETMLAHAEAVATGFGAHVTGLFVNDLPAITATGDSFGSADLAIELQNQAVARGNETAKGLADMVAKLAVPGELRRIDALPGQTGGAISREARAADLSVLIRPLGREDNEDAGALESVMFDSGRGVLYVPEGSTPPADWKTVMVAWNGSREAARAVAEAMPFLEAADKVIVVMADDHPVDEQDGEEPGADIARHLDRHGIDVELRHLTKWDQVHTAILNEAGLAGARLLVMGGYGHSRLRQWVTGGTTRGILTEAGLPVLMAH